MDSLFKKGMEFAQEYANKQEGQGNQNGQGQYNQNQNQGNQNQGRYNETSQGGFDSSNVLGNLGAQGQGQGQGGYGGSSGGQEDGYGGNQGGQGGQSGQQGNYGGNHQGGLGGQGSYGGGGGQQGNYGGNQGGQGGQGNYEGGENQFNTPGGAEYNRPHGSGGAGGGQSGIPNLDQSAALQAANNHSSHGNDSLFSSAFSMLQGMNKNQADDLDEDDVQKKHDQVYNQGNAGNMSANGIGAAAAMQAMKMFTSGNQQQGGNSSSNLIGMAMSEAAKMFDKSGGAAQGNKQDAVNSAGATIMKLLVKSQFSGTMGGGNSGGLSSLMGMASKFM